MALGPGHMYLALEPLWLDYSAPGSLLPLGSVYYSPESRPSFPVLLPVTPVVASLSFRYKDPFTPLTVHHGVALSRARR